MKKLTLLVISIICITIISCSSSDDDSNNGGNQIVNIKYEVTTSRNTEAVIGVTLNNDTQTNEVTALPFAFTYTQTEVDDGTYVQLTFLENGSYVVGTGGMTSWTDYTAELKIYVDNEVVASETFSVTENNSGVKTIDYTFN